MWTWKIVTANSVRPSYPISILLLISGDPVNLRTVWKRRCDRRHPKRASELAEYISRLTIIHGIEQKLFKLNRPLQDPDLGLLDLQLGFEPITRICVKIIRSWLHCVLPPHHLAHARNAGNSYREFCTVVLSPAYRSHVHTMQRETHNYSSLCRRGHAFGFGSAVFIRQRNSRRNIWLRQIWRRYASGIHFINFKTNTIKEKRNVGIGSRQNYARVRSELCIIRMIHHFTLLYYLVNNKDK